MYVWHEVFGLESSLRRERHFHVLNYAGIELKETKKVYIPIPYQQQERKNGNETKILMQANGCKGSA